MQYIISITFGYSGLALKFIGVYQLFSSHAFLRVQTYACLADVGRQYPFHKSQEPCDPSLANIPSLETIIWLSQTKYFIVKKIRRSSKLDMVTTVQWRRFSFFHVKPEQIKDLKKYGSKLSSQTFECLWFQLKMFYCLTTINGKNILYQTFKPTLLKPF